MLRGESMFLSLMGDIIQPTCVNPVEKAKAELKSYASEEPVNERPSMWWRVNCSRYSTLAVVAKSHTSNLGTIRESI